MFAELQKILNISLPGTRASWLNGQRVRFPRGGPGFETHVRWVFQRALKKDLYFDPYSTWFLPVHPRALDPRDLLIPVSRDAVSLTGMVTIREQQSRCLLKC